jgi:D-amino-acid oxidase
VQVNSDRSIAILGGGISGVTTAILLQMIGYRTVLYTCAEPSYEPDAARPSEFATLHAAASVLPHSVSSPNVARWTGISREFFRVLAARAGCGVRGQVHYEIFEDPVLAMPAYAESVDNFRFLTAEELSDSRVPRRSGAWETFGWKFDAFFCEAPVYVRYLYLLHGEIGGRVLGPAGNGGLSDYLALDHDIYVNCTGVGAHAFLRSATNDARCVDAPSEPDFEPLIDPVPPKLIRGHYLRIDTKGIVGEQPFSYNYKPLAEIYRNAAGAPADVYCYPRSDAWILGGSRQEGRIDGGRWVGDQTVGEEIEFRRPDGGSLAVPSAILRLNADILLRVSNGRLDLERLVRDHPIIVSPAIGYRFVRDSESDSVRTGCSRVEFGGARKYILHNYGHGGSGFTLSWGCAFDVLQMVGTVVDRSARAVMPRGGARSDVRYDTVRQALADLIARLVSREA